MHISLMSKGQLKMSLSIYRALVVCITKLTDVLKFRFVGRKMGKIVYLYNKIYRVCLIRLITTYLINIM